MKTKQFIKAYDLGYMDGYTARQLEEQSNAICDYAGEERRGIIGAIQTANPFQCTPAPIQPFGLISAESALYNLIFQNPEETGNN